jgi:hypothetical protein
MQHEAWNVEEEVVAMGYWVNGLWSKGVFAGIFSQPSLVGCIGGSGK